MAWVFGPTLFFILFRANFPSCGLLLKGLGVSTRWLCPMNKLRLLLISIAIIALASTLLNLNGCGGGGASISRQQIQHVVVIFQENRSPDNLFQDPVLVSRGADIASSGVNSKGQTIQLVQTDMAPT